MSVTTELQGGNVRAHTEEKLGRVDEGETTCSEGHAGVDDMRASRQ